MSGASLDSVRAKMRRARHHRDEFQTRLRGFLDGDPYHLTFDFDDKERWHNIRWAVTNVLPADDFGLIFSDMLGNLRSALDYLAWQLVLANNKIPDERTTFPVLEHARFGKVQDWVQKWASVSGDRFSGVDQRWIDEIERLQPYKRTKPPERDPLAILENINNIHKHRTLPVAITTMERTEMLIAVDVLPEGETLTFEEALDKSIEHRAVAVRFRASTKQQLHVQVNQPTTYRISFRDTLGFDWGNNDDLIRWVEEIVAVFEPAFP